MIENKEVECESCKSKETTLTKEILDGLMETVRNLYCADDIPWVVGYSGGKDSTATLQLVWLSLLELPKEKLKKKVHIINTDTLVESPVVARWAAESLKKMEQINSIINFPFNVQEDIFKYKAICEAMKDFC